MLRFYKQQHQFYCGIDLHAMSMHICVVNQTGEVLVHRNLPTYKFVFGNVTWHCNDGHLTLHGCVPNFYLKQVLQELLRGIERVKLITNSVDVVSATGLSSDRSDIIGLPPIL